MNSRGHPLRRTVRLDEIQKMPMTISKKYDWSIPTLQAKVMQTRSITAGSKGLLKFRWRQCCLSLTITEHADMQHAPRRGCALRQPPLTI